MDKSNGVFDSARYDCLSIGKEVTIFFDVTILVRDYSIAHAARTVGKKASRIIFKPVSIGNNVFIGAKSIVLPGSTICDNCIIGGEKTVVKGYLESDSIYADNPYKNRNCF
jgi:maltose O-acetyltransferase